MSSRYGTKEELLKAITLFSSYARTIIRQDGTPASRGTTFRNMMSYPTVIELLGHGHPFLIEAEKRFLAAADGDSGIRAVAAWVASLSNELSLPTPPARPRSAKPVAEAAAPQEAEAAAPAAPSPDDLHRPGLKWAGVEDGRLYVAVPLRSWCAPFVRLWHLRKRTRVSLFVAVAGLFGIAGLTLGWVAAVGGLAVTMAGAIVIAALLPKPPGTAS